MLWKRASSRIEGRISWFFSSCGRSLGFLSSCDGDFRDPFVLPQVSWVSSCAARGLLGFLLSPCRRIGPCLQFSWETQCSSLAVTGMSGFFIKVQLGSQALSGVKAWISAFLSSCAKGVRAPVEFRRGIWAFSRGSAWETNLPSCCEGILEVPLEPVQGNQDLSRTEGALGVLYP